MTTTPASAAGRLDRLAVFDLLVAAARAGKRCPTNDIVGGHNMATLAASGKIRIEVYCLNWRTIEILTGEHAGSRTQECPHGDKPKPFRIIDADGSNVQTAVKRRAQATLPDFKDRP